MRNNLLQSPITTHTLTLTLGNILWKWGLFESQRCCWFSTGCSWSPWVLLCSTPYQSPSCPPWWALRTGTDCLVQFQRTGASCAHVCMWWGLESGYTRQDLWLLGNQTSFLRQLAFQLLAGGMTDDCHSWSTRLTLDSVLRSQCFIAYRLRSGVAVFYSCWSSRLARHHLLACLLLLIVLLRQHCYQRSKTCTR